MVFSNRFFFFYSLSSFRDILLIKQVKRQVEQLEKNTEMDKLGNPKMEELGKTRSFLLSEKETELAVQLDKLGAKANKLEKHPTRTRRAERSFPMTEPESRNFFRWKEGKKLC